MYTEKQITEKWPFTKAELVKLRKSGNYVEKEDYVWGKAKNGVKRVMWTIKGVSRLLESKDIKTLETEKVDISPEPSSVINAEIKPEENLTSQNKSNDRAPAIVRQKFPNKRLVACQIRGAWENVLVRDSSLLRIGSIITAVNRGGRWVGEFKVGSNGRIHAP